MNRNEKHILVAEFMGASVKLEGEYYNTYTWTNGNRMIQSTPINWDGNPETTLENLYAHLCNSEYGRWGKFDNDWNALMQVIEKLKSVTEEPEDLDVLRDILWWGSIEQVFDSVIDNIIDYNAKQI